ncbi:MAG: hypothetical protein ACRC2T_04690 [Thermoguttaceae bacterium]
MSVAIDDLLLAAFSRWRVERSFQDTKQKLGLGDYEGRCYTGLVRHLLLCSLAYYFLQSQRLELSKKRRSDILPGIVSGVSGVATTLECTRCVGRERILSRAKRLGHILP